MLTRRSILKSLAAAVLIPLAANLITWKDTVKEALEVVKTVQVHGGSMFNGSVVADFTLSSESGP